MKLSTHVAITALLVLVGSVGVLYPVHNKIVSLEEGVATLETQGNAGVSVDVQLQVIRDQIAEFEEDVEGRSFRLCPDTPEARHAFESSVHDALETSGLRRVSMDRKPGGSIAGVPCFLLNLVVEGTGTQLHGFLSELESLEWVSRVLKLDVGKGEEHRRITMQVAVMLESES